MNANSFACAPASSDGRVFPDPTSPIRQYHDIQSMNQAIVLDRLVRGLAGDGDGRVLAVPSCD